MANLKKTFVDPWGVDPEPPQAAPVAGEPEPVAAALVEVVPAPPKPKAARQRRTEAAEAPSEDNGVGDGAGGAEPELETLFARVPADIGDWLRELRWRHRLPAAALVRALLQLAREDERLLQRAVALAKKDGERPGPRRRSR